MLSEETMYYHTLNFNCLPTVSWFFWLVSVQKKTWKTSFVACFEEITKFKSITLHHEQTKQKKANNIRCLILVALPKFSGSFSIESFWEMGFWCNFYSIFGPSCYIWVREKPIAFLSIVARHNWLVYRLLVAERENFVGCLLKRILEKCFSDFFVFSMIFFGSHVFVLLDSLYFQSEKIKFGILIFRFSINGFLCEMSFLCFWNLLYWKIFQKYHVFCKTLLGNCVSFLS